MQSLRLSLYGRFWDSHIYSGRLYLFDREGGIQTVDWDGFIGSCGVPSELMLAMSCAFGRSDYLYGAHWSPMFNDAEVKQLLVSKFDRLHAFLRKVGPPNWQAFVSYHQGNPFAFPHTDARIYARTIYVASDDGLSHSNCDKKSVRGISRRVTKDWDCPVLSISAFSNTLAMAAGEQGLFEKRIGNTWWDYGEELGDDDVKRITEQHCGQCEWTFYSVFGSSHDGGGFLASYAVDRKPWEATAPPQYIFDNEPVVEERADLPTRHFESIVPADDIFHEHGFSWANREKLYQAVPGVIRAKRYTPWKEDPQERFESLPDIHLAPWKGNVVDAGVAMFGTIVECDNCLVVILSDGSTQTIADEPVRWRVFPRSKHYENQLHVIYEDRLDVWSFNHDYFVDQASKVAGLEHRR